MAAAVDALSASFVTAYYSTVVSHPEEVKNFYDESASICRGGVIYAGCDAPDVSERLVIKLSSGSQFAVARAIALRFRAGATVIVDGYMKHESAKNAVWRQVFTMENVQNRWFIVADCLEVREGPIPPDLASIELKPYGGAAVQDGDASQQKHGKASPPSVEQPDQVDVAGEAPSTPQASAVLSDEHRAPGGLARRGRRPGGTAWAPPRPT